MTETTHQQDNTGSDPFRIGAFEVDPNTHVITRDGETTKLEPRAMALLLYLARRPGTVVGREELEREVWSGMVVGYDALNNTVAKIRKAFGDDPKKPRVIRTVPKVGYQLIAEVGVVAPPAEPRREVHHQAPDPSLERKLAAILYADVADYSRLTGLDEDGTHRELRACLELITSLVDNFNGNVVHFAGDAILADFTTASSALSCAVVVQQELAERCDGITEARKMRFRVGVNLGEVIVDRNDIYGDGVNIAARLESLAVPGGICISGSVFDAIGHKLPLDFSFLGERQVKNIEKPVRAYHARLKPGATVAPPQRRTGKAAARQASRWPVAMLAALVLVAGVALLAWWQPWQSGESAAVPVQVAAGKPTIAVLPFENISDDPAQEFFADGMTDDLITDLSGISELAVISRQSVFAYKNRAVSMAQIARELGVRYVLEGSVKRIGGKIRINANLIDAATDRSLWSERYDSDAEELFTLQNRVIGNIVSALAVELTDQEKTILTRLPTESLEAYDYYLRAERRRLVAGGQCGRRILTGFGNPETVSKGD